MGLEGQVSPDGQWTWDGRRWVATGAVAAPQSSARGFRRITGWKVALIGVAGLFVLGAIGAIGSAVAQPPATSTAHQIAQVEASAAPSTYSTAPSPSPKTVASPSPSPSPVAKPSPVVAPVVAPVAAPVAAPAPQNPYAAATAAGASAVCADGSWSYSKNRSGTCSSHGGVHWWTGNLGAPGPGAH
jgi:serine/threonine-protein kinase